MADALSLPLRILYNLNRSPQYILARSSKKYPVSIVPHHHTPVFHYASTLPVQEAPAPATLEGPKYVYGSVSLKACLDSICCASPELMQDASRDYSVYVLDPLESQPVAGISADAHAMDQQNSSQPGISSSISPPQPVAVGLGLMSWALLADERESITVNGTVLNLATGQEVLQVIFALREAFPIRKTELPDALRSWGLPPPPSKRVQVHASRPHRSSKSGKYNSERRYSSSQSSHPRDAHTSSDVQLSRSEQILDSANVYVGPPRRKAGRPSKSSDPSSSTNVTTHASDDVLPTTSTNPTETSLADFLSNLSSSAQNAALISVLSSIDGQNKGTPNPALVDALKQLLSTSPHTGFDSSSTLATPQQNHVSKPPSDDDIVILDKENVNPTAFKRRADREDAKPSTGVADLNRLGRPLSNMQNSPPLISSDGPGVSRKRTLSEFMDERERERQNRTRGRVDGPSRITHHLPSLASHTMSSCRSASIPRRVPSDENAVPNAGPATSPLRPPRRHGVPEWARTTTATQPRFPKETEEYLKRKAAEVKHKKKETRRERRGAGLTRHSSDVGPGPLEGEVKSPVWGLRRACQSVEVERLESQIAKAATSKLPVFASDLQLPPSSPPPSSPIRALPETPIRRSVQHSPIGHNLTPEQYSLFTPTPKSWMSNPRNRLGGPASGGSPLSSPCFLSGWGEKIARRLEKKSEKMNNQCDTEVSDGEFDTEEHPPSSLPIASSDAEAERSLDDQETPDCETEFQHWIGLPPSSPPPPTSPILAPQEDSSDDMNDTSVDSNNYNDNGYSSEVESLNTGDDLSMSLDDLGRLFASGADDLTDVFARFSESQPESVDALTTQEQDHGDFISSSEDGMVEFDFTEFWQSVKPLVGLQGEGQTDGTSSPGCGSGDDPGADPGAIDHSKLAAEVQALFSGCLM